MNKFKEIWQRIRGYVRTDGLLHIETSALIFALFASAFCFYVGLLVTILTGFLKEVYDRVSGKGTAEWHDIICDGIGLLVGVLIWSLPWW